jgi:hypothetical protein
VTRVAGEPLDEATIVRPSSRFRPRRPSGRVVVPLGTAITSSFDHARATARLFFEPMSNGRWAAPAVLALAGCITFGTVAYRESHDDLPLPSVQAVEAAPARPASPPLAAKPLATAERAPEPPQPANRDDDGATKRVDERRAKADARPPKDNALKKIGRAFRVDRHLRKLF